jgi:hypothetical protein
VQVRLYDPADRDQVLALAPRLTEGVASWRDPAAVLAAVESWVRSSADSAAQPGRAVFVATIGQRVVGLVTLAERAGIAPGRSTPSSARGVTDEHHSGLRRALSRQNSLPSGSDRTCHDSSPVWPMSAGRAPSFSRRTSSAS